MSLNELIKRAKTTVYIIKSRYEQYPDFLIGEKEKLQKEQWVSVKALKPKLDALNELMKRQPLPEAFAWQNDFKSQYEHWTRKLKEVLGSDEKEPSQTRNVYPCGER